MIEENMGQAYRHTGIQSKSVFPAINSINAMRRWLYDKQAAEVYSHSEQHAAYLRLSKNRNRRQFKK